MSRSESRSLPLPILPPPSVSEVANLATPVAEAPDTDEEQVPSTEKVEHAVLKPKRARTRDIRASEDIHLACQYSLLSPDAPPQNFRGLYNLAGLALVVMNFRLVVENLLKYGWLLKFPTTDYRTWPKTWPCLSGTLAMYAFPLCSLMIEQLAWAQSLSSKAAGWLHFVSLLLASVFPIYVIEASDGDILPSLLMLFIAIVIVLKLVSFAHVNNDLRREAFATKRTTPSGSGRGKPKKTGKDVNSTLRQRKGQAKTTTSNTDSEDADASSLSQEELVEKYHPHLQHLYYFIAAPTLVYQLAYPRTQRIRKRFLFRRSVELLFCIALMVFLAEQYVVPTVTNSLKWLDDNPAHTWKRWAYLTERLFKLAVPNACIWLTMFYALFHSFMNLTSELLRFGDRLFYKDWWNAPSLDVYWRSWNLPVHHWVVRHVYAPALRHGFSSLQAQLIVFVLSAAIHELLVSVPCHMVKFTAFWGFIGQVPLILLTKWVVRKFKRPVWGNLVFWATFLVFGQPAMIMIYYHAYIRKHQDQLAAV